MAFSGFPTTIPDSQEGPNTLPDMSQALTVVREATDAESELSDLESEEEEEEDEGPSTPTKMSATGKRMRMPATPKSRQKKAILFDRSTPFGKGSALDNAIKLIEKLTIKVNKLEEKTSAAAAVATAQLSWHKARH